MLDVKVKSGGLLDKALKHIPADVKTTLEVGLRNGATYPDGTSVAYVGYINEYGRGNNPRRPFLKRTIKRRGRTWTGIAHATLQQYGYSDEGIHVALKRIGMTAVQDVKKTIAKWPPGDPRYNKPATIARKARKGRSGKNMVAADPTRALHDTGEMLKNITYEVVD